MGYTLQRDESLLHIAFFFPVLLLFLDFVYQFSLHIASYPSKRTTLRFTYKDSYVLTAFIIHFLSI